MKISRRIIEWIRLRWLRPILFWILGNWYSDQFRIMNGIIKRINIRHQGYNDEAMKMRHRILELELIIKQSKLTMWYETVHPLEALDYPVINVWKLDDDCRKFIKKFLETEAKP